MGFRSPTVAMGSICSCNRQDSLKPVFISGSNAKNTLDVSTLLSKKHHEEDDFALSPVQTPLLTGVNFDVTHEDQESSDSVDDEEIEQLLNEEDHNDDIKTHH